MKYLKAENYQMDKEKQQQKQMINLSFIMFLFYDTDFRKY